jgi:hypothetical protein
MGMRRTSAVSWAWQAWARPGATGGPTLTAGAVTFVVVDLVDMKGLVAATVAPGVPVRIIRNVRDQADHGAFKVGRPNRMSSEPRSCIAS